MWHVPHLKYQIELEVISKDKNVARATLKVSDELECGLEKTKVWHVPHLKFQMNWNVISKDKNVARATFKVSDELGCDLKRQECGTCHT